jgi:S1-C subfamily serine protease
VKKSIIFFISTILFITSLSVFSDDFRGPDNKEFEKKQEERAQILEDILKRADECRDQICGKWRISASGYSVTLVFYPTPNTDWEFEGMVFDKGNTGRFGYSKGDIISYYNKVGSNEYVGEDMVRSFLFVLGWMPTAVYLKDGDRMTRVETPPPGMNVVGTIQSGIRLGKKKSRPTEANPSSLSKGELVGTGSGFFITKAGHILTNHHVINQCGSIKIVKRGIVFDAVLVGSDPVNDLAVLKITENVSDIASFRSGKGIRVGDDIVVIGYPLIEALGSNIKVTKGNVSALTGINNDVTNMQITAPIQLGNSGGPLLDSSGNVVGIVSSKLNEIAVAQVTGSLSQNVNFAIKSSTAQTFLDVNRIDYEVNESINKLETADNVEIAEKFTTLIQCFH